MSFHQRSTAQSFRTNSRASRKEQIGVPSSAFRRGLWDFFFAVLVLAVAACSSTGSQSIDQGDLAGWEVATVSVGEENLLVAVADEPTEWSQGLKRVENFGDLDGMLFVFHEELQTSVWMKDTPVAIDIAFFDSAGILVDAFHMDPCVQDPCRQYSASAPFAWALETPAGSLDELRPSTSIVVGER
jgi:uncharacterized protein